MLDIGRYYLFKPPYSESEYFVRVTDVKKNQENEKQYVYYDHVLNDMEGNCERKPFESGSHHLTQERIETIISNLESEIESLSEKKRNFKRLHDQMEEDSTSINSKSFSDESSNKTKRVETKKPTTPTDNIKKEAVPLDH